MISRGPAESCKMNKCCFEPVSLKKAVLFVQRWCGQQTLFRKKCFLPRPKSRQFNLQVSRRFFISCLYSRLCRNLLADVTPAPFFFTRFRRSSPDRDLPMTQRGPAEEAGKHPPLGTSVTDSKHLSSTFKDIAAKNGGVRKANSTKCPSISVK